MTLYIGTIIKKLCVRVYTKIARAYEEKFGLSFVSDKSCGLSRGFCKDVCRTYRRTFHNGDSKVFAKAHMQVFFGVCDVGGIFCIVQKLHSTVFGFHGKINVFASHDCVFDGFDVALLRLRCDVPCGRWQRAFFGERTPKRQVRLSPRQEFCFAQRRHMRLGCVFEHFTHLFAMK